jgi:flagellar basal body P-ring formation protein FlgA
MVRRMAMFVRPAAALALSLAASAPLAAADLTLPVPTIILYPGDMIRDNILVDREVALPTAAVGSVIDNRAALVGKVARRTLLPGKPIPLIGVADPKVVLNGSQVRVVFEEGGLTISTYATALQAGGVGDVIKLRNPESGLILSGMVQADGSVRIGDS